MERTKTEIDSAVYRHARDLAESYGRDERELLDELVEESVRMREFPGIVFRDGPAGRRAHVVGTGMDVWQIVEGYRANGADAEATLSTGKISEHDLRLALAYCEAHPEEIDRMTEENSRPAAWWQERYPAPDVRVKKL